MVKNIEQEYAPRSRPGTYHVYVFAKGFVIISRIDRSISIAFYIIVQRYFFITYQLLEIVPVPFGISRPLFSKIFDNYRGAGFIKLSGLIVSNVATGFNCIVGNIIIGQITNCRANSDLSYNVLAKACIFKENESL
jgi:hypothetical protein